MTAVSYTHLDVYKRQVFDCGIRRVIIGTKAVQNPGFVKEAISVFGADRIVVGAVSYTHLSKDLKVKDAQEYVENMCAANQLNTKVHIFKDLGPFYRRLDALEREKPDVEKEDELLHIKACMLAISL